MALLLKHACSRRPLFGVSQSITGAIRSYSHGIDSKHSHVVDHHEITQEAPKTPHEIYKGTITKQVRGVKTFSLGTSLIGLGMQPMLYEQLSNGDNSTSVLIALSSIIGFFTFLTPFLIHYVTKKYVTDITYNPAKEEYTASVYNLLLTKKKIIFKLEDVSVPDVPGAFTSFYVGKIPLMCNPNDFLYPDHYIKFMGYDKPIDFHMNAQDDSTKKTN